MAKEHKSKSRSHRNIPILPVAGTVIALAQPVLYSLGKGGTVMDIAQNTANGFSVNFLAYDFVQRKATASGLVNGYAPPILGIIGHKTMNYLGVNRILASAKLGFVL